MTTHPHGRAQAPYWSLPGLAEGARLCDAMVPGTVVFAAAYGTLAAQKGLTLFEAVLMSALVYGGASQLVAMEVWTTPLTLSTRNAWFSAPRRNFSSSRARNAGVAPAEIAI